MKILLRQWDGKCYVWMDATYNKERYFTDEAGYVSETQVLAVKDHDLDGRVICKYCGAIIKDDPESIEKHYAEEEAKKDCLSCRHLRENQLRDGRNIKKQYKKNEDGTYSVVSTYDALLYCGNNYSNYVIGTANADKNCIHNLHRARGVRPYGGTLIKYPDLFAKQITVDALNKRGFKFKEYDSGYFEYDLKCRGTLFACVNEHGIVDHFNSYGRAGDYVFYYSATQKKLFYSDGGKYTEGVPYYMSDTKYETIKKKIESLYEEANVNE